MELWEAVDYLLRTSQAKKALPYIDKFMKAKPGRRDLDRNPKSVRAWLDPQAQRRPVDAAVCQTVVGSNAGGFAQ